MTMKALLICDSCGTTAKTNSFNTLINYLKKANWKTIKKDEKFKHLCPHCHTKRVSHTTEIKDADRNIQSR